MNFFNFNNYDCDSIRPVNEILIQKIMYECTKIKEGETYNDVYNKLYTSKYAVQNLSGIEKRLEQYLDQQANLNPRLIHTEYQGKYYKRIFVNWQQMERIDFRYYFALNPKYMHEIVQRLTAQFIAKRIPVQFKFQLQAKASKNDRIIIYSDSKSRKDIESAIHSVYLSRPNLFADSEHPLPWLYESNTPNVYLAPELTGDFMSYGQRFARTIVEAKDIFCYLCNLKSINNKINLTGEEIIQAFKLLETVVNSMLLRNQLLIRKNGDKIIYHHDRITSNYNRETGELVSDGQDIYGRNHKVIFSNNELGRNILMDNFYLVSSMPPQNGIIVKH